MPKLFQAGGYRVKPSRKPRATYGDCPKRGCWLKGVLPYAQKKKGKKVKC